MDQTGVSKRMRSWLGDTVNPRKCGLGTRFCGVETGIDGRNDICGNKTGSHQHQQFMGVNREINRVLDHGVIYSCGL